MGLKICNCGHNASTFCALKCIKHIIYKLPYEGSNGLTQVTLGLGVNLTFSPVSICQYNFTQSSNSLFTVGWKLKNADVICYMLTIFLQQRNVKKSEKSMEVVNTVGENLHIFWKNSGKMQLMIMLKFTKKMTLSLQKNTFLEKPQEWCGERFGKTDSPVFLGLRLT